MNNNDVRVRFAPSPTGDLHLGSARTALFNWLYAKHTGGKLILRIEDTDKKRSTDEAVSSLLADLSWLGIDYDEGAFYQSERDDLYNNYLNILLMSDKAYEKDGAVWFKLDGERRGAYDAWNNERYEKVDSDPITFTDALRGTVTRSENRDFVLRKTGGSYGFHLTNVVDDIEMRISHVIRGDDHLSNTSKHILLYNAFKRTPPIFCHIPLVLKPVGTGKGKLGKRDGGATIGGYFKDKYHPQALVNYIALLGWNPKCEKEIMDMDELAQRFDFKGLNKSAARFDPVKLKSFDRKWKAKS